MNKDALIDRLRKQFDETVTVFRKEEEADHIAERKRIRAARVPAGRIPVKAWDETYTVQIHHEPVRAGNGRDATISAPGVVTKIMIRQKVDVLVEKYQQSKRNRYQGRYVKKANPNASWTIWINDGKKDVVLQDSVTDFEAAVQQGIVTLLGHMYYDL